MTFLISNSACSTKAASGVAGPVGFIGVHAAFRSPGACFVGVEHTRPNERVKPAAPPDTVDGVRVLVVEDEIDMADAVARGLRREGYAVDVAYDGTTALEKLGYTD